MLLAAVGRAGFRLGGRCRGVDDPLQSRGVSLRPAHQKVLRQPQGARLPPFLISPIKVQSQSAELSLQPLRSEKARAGCECRALGHAS